MIRIRPQARKARRRAGGASKHGTKVTRIRPQERKALRRVEASEHGGKSESDPATRAKSAEAGTLYPHVRPHLLARARCLRSRSASARYIYIAAARRIFSR